MISDCTMVIVLTFHNEGAQRELAMVAHDLADGTCIVKPSCVFGHHGSRMFGDGANKLLVKMGALGLVESPRIIFVVMIDSDRRWFTTF